MDAQQKHEIMWDLTQRRDQMIDPVQWAILTMLSEIHEELVKIREATEAEAVEDAEPNPFQTLNGPRIGDCVSPIIGGYADPLDPEGPVVTKEWIPDPPYTGWDK